MPKRSLVAIEDVLGQANTLDAALKREVLLRARIVYMEAAIDRLMHLKPSMLKDMHRVLLLLRKKRMTAEDISVSLQIAPSSVAKHLRELRQPENRHVRIADYKPIGLETGWTPVYEARTPQDKTPLRPDEIKPSKPLPKGIFVVRIKTIRHVLAKSRMTCAELAKTFGVSVSTVNDTLNKMHDAEPPLVRIADYCRAPNGIKWTALFEAREPDDMRPLAADVPMPPDKTSTERVRAYRQRLRTGAVYSKQDDPKARAPFTMPLTQPNAPSSIQRDAVVAAFFGNQNAQQSRTEEIV